QNFTNYNYGLQIYASTIQQLQLYRAYVDNNGISPLQICNATFISHPF
ncbi:7427_t:CDS:1, partial [Dentiscutata heterogama]